MADGQAFSQYKTSKPHVYVDNLNHLIFFCNSLSNCQPSNFKAMNII